MSGFEIDSSRTGEIMIFTYMHAYMRICVHMCAVRTYGHACVRACLDVHMQVHVHAGA